MPHSRQLKTTANKKIIKGRANNKVGVKGLLKCPACRHAKQKCDYDHEKWQEPCRQCVKKQLPCGEKFLPPRTKKNSTTSFYNDLKDLSRKHSNMDPETMNASISKFLSSNRPNPVSVPANQINSQSTMSSSTTDISLNAPIEESPGLIDLNIYPQHMSVLGSLPLDSFTAVNAQNYGFEGLLYDPSQIFPPVHHGSDPVLDWNWDPLACNMFGQSAVTTVSQEGTSTSPNIAFSDPFTANSVFSASEEILNTPGDSALSAHHSNSPPPAPLSDFDYSEFLQLPPDDLFNQ